LPSSFGFLSNPWFKTDAGHSFGKIENDCRIENPVFGKARIEHFDRGIRISFAWLQARRFSGVLGDTRSVRRPVVDSLELALPTKSIVSIASTKIF
jgi:hypothetical protein